MRREYRTTGNVLPVFARGRVVYFAEVESQSDVTKRVRTPHSKEIRVVTRYGVEVAR